MIRHFVLTSAHFAFQVAEFVFMNAKGFSFGDRVRVLTGKYSGLAGVIVDSAQDSDALPPPRPGHYWIRIGLHNYLVPVHVSEADIQLETEQS